MYKIYMQTFILVVKWAPC